MARAMSGRARPGRDRRRLRAERPGRGHHPAPCRALGPGLRGGRDDRWRHPDRGADPARLPPRRVLDDPAPDRGLTVHAHHRLGGPRRRAGPSRCARGPRPGAGPERAARTVRGGHRGRPRRPRRAGLAAALRAARPRRRQALRGAAPAGHPRPAAPAGDGPLRAAGPALGARPGPGALPRRAGPGPVRGPGRPRDAVPGPAAERQLRDGPRDVRPCRRLADGPRRLLGRGRGPGRRDPRARWRDRHRPAGHRAWPSIPEARAVILDTTPRAALAIAGERLAARHAPRLRARSATARACSSSTGRSMARCPGRTRRPPARPPSTWAGRSTTSPPPRRPSRPAATPSARTCCSSSTARGTPRAPRRAGRPPGPTATCPPGSDVDMTERIEAQVERVAPGFRDRILARSAMGTGAMEAHDSNYVGGRHQRRRPGHPPAVLPPDPLAGPVSRRARHLPVLVIDPARRRRPRHGRPPRGAIRAAPRALRGGLTRCDVVCRRSSSRSS